VIPSVFHGIRTCFHSVVFQVAQNIEQAAKLTVEAAIQIGKILLRMKTDLKRKEYKIFLGEPGWTTAKANKYIKLAKTFDGFELSQLIKIELTTLFSLCAKTYQCVVDQLRDMQQITQDVVERLMKESRPPRKPRQQSSPGSGWKQNANGGGRHYAITLYDEQTGIEIEKMALELGLLPQKIIAKAIAREAQNDDGVTENAHVFGGKLTHVTLREYSRAQADELKETIDEMRALHIEKERLEIKLERIEAEKKAEIEKLRAYVQELEQKLTDDSEQQLSQSVDAPVNMVSTLNQYGEMPHTKNWEEIAQAVECQGNRLLDIAKKLTSSERSALVDSLVDHLQSEPSALDNASWIPEKLLKKALLDLSYTLRKIGGPENLMDEPEIEYIHELRFVSLEYFGTSKEMWIFEDSNKKRYPIFGIDAITIEKF